MKNILLVFVWWIITSTTFALSIRTLIYIFPSSKVSQPIQNSEEKGLLYQTYASLPQTMDPSLYSIKTADAREDVVRQYLQRYNSPLTPHASDIISLSDRYKTPEVENLWQYVVAIAQCESNLGARIPEGSFNAWGLGIPTGAKKGLEFDSWPHGIEIASKFLRKLIDRGLTSPGEWEATYAPPATKNGNSWSKCVREFTEALN